MPSACLLNGSVPFYLRRGSKILSFFAESAYFPDKPRKTRESMAGKRGRGREREKGEKENREEKDFITRDHTFWLRPDFYFNWNETSNMTKDYKYIR